MKWGSPLAPGDDAYTRLPFDPDKCSVSTLHGGGLTFVDIDAGDRIWSEVLGWFETTPPALLARAFAVLLRWPSVQRNREPDVWPTATEGLRELARRLVERQIHARLGAVVFEIGHPPRIEWSEESPLGVDEAALLQRARLVELASFLDWGDAIWQPSGYHYCLPSGHHAKTFIRVADALRDPRAPAALATWLYAGVAREGATTVVVDSGTLAPIVAELRMAAEVAGARVAQMIGLDSYPVSSFEHRRLLKGAEFTQVLGILSVSSTGRLQARFGSVLRETVDDAFRLETLVGRGEERQADFVPVDLVNGLQAPWLTLREQLDTPVLPTGPTGCEACRDPSTAPLVHIHPASMSAMALPEPQLLVPDIFDGRRNRSLWERYNSIPPELARSTISPDGPTGTRHEPARLAAGPAQIFFEPARLFRAGGLDELLSNRHDELAKLAKRSKTDRLVRWIASALEVVTDTRPDAIVVDSEEFELFSDSEWSEVLNALHTFTRSRDSQLVVHRERSDSPIGTLTEVVSNEEMIPSPRSVLLLALGLRTGVTLQRMFLAARETWPEAQLRGIVAHAHPSDSRVWDSIRNTFKDDTGTSRLLALWLTYLPRRSPIFEEREVLRTVQRSELPGDAIRDLVQRRLEEDRPLWLWGDSDTMLRPTSYFGDRLTADVALVAVGSAMHAERLRSRKMGTPYWAMFNMPRIFRSYFDGLIHAAVLRWLEPGEAWWGTPDDCVLLLQETEQRAPADWRFLLPELLLAGAQSKLPRPAIDYLVGVADARIPQWEPEIALWSRLGMWLGERVLID